MSNWRYPSIVDCHLILFPNIRQVLYDEIEDKRPRYEFEENGLRELQKTLTFIKNDEYYPSLFDKAAYLFLSVTKGHYFSNGNKRLATTLTAFFLITNKQVIICSQLSAIHDWFEMYFPYYHIDIEHTPIPNFPFYHLNKVITDNNLRYGFSHCKQIISEYLSLIVI